MAEVLPSPLPVATLRRLPGTALVLSRAQMTQRDADFLLTAYEEALTRIIATDRELGFLLSSRKFRQLNPPRCGGGSTSRAI